MLARRLHYPFIATISGRFGSHVMKYSKKTNATLAAQALPISPPSLLQTMRELRVVWEATRAATGWLSRRRHRGQARPVMVIPGFLATDTHTWPLRRHLSGCGFKVYPWELGINRGPRGDTLRKLALRVRAISQLHGEPVQLVGWSLGGLLARLTANRTQTKVSRVITLGSPLSGDPNCSRLGPLLRAVGGGLNPRKMRRLLLESQQMPVISIFSRSDGVVAWRASANCAGDDTSIEVDSSHIGMVVNPDVLDVLARQLNQPANAFASASI